MTNARALLSEFWKAPTVAAAARLGVADHLDGALGAGALAERLGVDVVALLRLLRALASLGLVEHHDGDIFSLTEDGRALRSDSAESVLGMAGHVGTMLLPAYLELDRCVRTGRPPPGIKYGPDGFAALIDNPEEARIFNQSMVDTSRRIAARAADAYDFSRFRHVMDVGGGYGAVLAVLLQRHSGLEGSILDLAHAREGALAYLAAEGVADRAAFMEGSFFDGVPASADAYVLKYIIHDWSDDYAAKVMARVGAAANEAGAAVILIERIVPDLVEARPDHGNIAFSDLTMMLWDGRERKIGEFAALFASSGLALARTVDIGEGHFVIEAQPAGSIR